MNTKTKIRRASGIIEADTMPPSENPDLKNAAAPGELSDAELAGISNMAKDIGEAIEMRLNAIVTAAVKAGKRQENRAGVVAMADYQTMELMSEARQLVTTGLMQHFDGTDPISDNILGNYSACL